MDTACGIPISGVADAVASLDEARVAARFGRTFLVLLHVRVPKGPRVAHQTVRHAAMPRGDTQPHQTEMLVFPLRKGAASELPFVSIGRLAGNDVVLPSETVSKFHAYVKANPAGDFLLLQDGRSANGSFVDGERVARRGEGPPAELRPGAAVRFGDMSMVFLDLAGLLRLARTAQRESLRA